ncbi:MAG: hypothetical protein ABIQ99_00805 [Thermoflexales bacterium]
MSGSGVAVGIDVLVGAGTVALAVGVDVGVARGVAVAEAVADGVDPGVRVGLAVAVTDAVGVGVPVDVVVGVLTSVPVAVGGSEIVGMIGPRVSVARDIGLELGDGGGVTAPVFPGFPPGGPTRASRTKPTR